MARICADCRQPIPPGERPEDHLCVTDRDEPEERGDGDTAASLTVSVSGPVTTERDLLEAIRRGLSR